MNAVLIFAHCWAAHVGVHVERNDRKRKMVDRNEEADKPGLSEESQ